MFHPMGIPFAVVVGSFNTTLIFFRQGVRSLEDVKWTSFKNWQNHNSSQESYMKAQYLDSAVKRESLVFIHDLHTIIKLLKRHRYPVTDIGVFWKFPQSALEDSARDSSFPFW